MGYKRKQIITESEKNRIKKKIPIIIEIFKLFILNLVNCRTITVVFLSFAKQVDT